ncbi:MAG: cupin domain-containing protein [Rhodospirillaceae bacterium]
MRRHWQKKPLLVRGALPEYADLVDPSALQRLAQRDDVVSRLVMRVGERWQVLHGPFTRAQLRRLPARGWSLLVQGVDHVLPRAGALLREFGFLPYARLDDVMVSYAPPGGGVGPHFDSYDVFLLQRAGERRWRTSAQRDLALVPDAPLRILQRFRPQREWTVRPGDLLYLPPHHAHDGVAVSDCITISVGFRAPSAAEVIGRFLDHLQDTVSAEGIYADPELEPARHPAKIGDDMLRKFARMLAAIRWTDRDVGEFAGRYLTEPKQHVVFARPAQPMTRSAFGRAVSRHGVRLALNTAMLFHGTVFFINGDSHRVSATSARLLRRLADRRLLQPPLTCDTECLELLHEWYRAGYLHPDANPEKTP